MDPVALWEFAKTGGLMSGMAAFIWALYKGWLVWGSDHRNALAQKDKDISRLETALSQSQTENRGYIDSLKSRLDRWEAQAEAERNARKSEQP